MKFILNCIMNFVISIKGDRFELFLILYYFLSLTIIVDLNLY